MNTGIRQVAVFGRFLPTERENFQNRSVGRCAPHQNRSVTLCDGFTLWSDFGALGVVLHIDKFGDKTHNAPRTTHHGQIDGDWLVA